VKLTDLTVQKLSVPASGAKIYSDDTLPSFGVKVRCGGSKTFILTVGRERKRVTLGRYPLLTLAEARKKAHGILRDLELGIVHNPSPTFEAVKDEYLARRDTEVRALTRQADGYLFKLFDAFSHRKIADIRPAAIEDMLNAIEAPTTRRHSFIRLQGLFRYATRREYLDRSPMERLKCPSDVEPRDRVLSDAELRHVILSDRAYGHPYGTIVELCAILGQRRNQIGALNTAHVDWKNSTLEWPGHLMKTGRKHLIPFGPMTDAILRGIQPDENGLFFASRTGSGFVGWSYHKARFDEQCGVDFHLHDLRRTLATRWQEMGIEIAATEKYLSHSAVTGGLVGIYQRSAYLEQMKAAVLLWEAKLQALLSDTDRADRAA
jgi:integrase